MDSTNNRWHLAQSYEKGWWESRSSQIDFEFYKNYAAEMAEFGSEYIQINSETKILEIGSGAGGILTYLSKSKHRFAIDPLEYFYSSVQEFVEQRDKDVEYYAAKGENLPFPENSFNLIIMDNVLDHCDKPENVMKEVARVMLPDAYVYFKQNTYNIWGKFIRFIMELLKIDKGHPHTFTKKNLIRLFHSNDLQTKKYKKSGYLQTWKREISSKNRKDILKALLLVTRDKVFYILKK